MTNYINVLGVVDEAITTGIADMSSAMTSIQAVMIAALVFGLVYGIVRRRGK
jgi:hypothetical protein